MFLYQIDVQCTWSEQKDNCWEKQNCMVLFRHWQRQQPNRIAVVWNAQFNSVWITTTINMHTGQAVETQDWMPHDQPAWKAWPISIRIHAQSPTCSLINHVNKCPLVFKCRCIMYLYKIQCMPHPMSTASDLAK